MALLQEGDVIEIKEGHRVYADVPKHFLSEIGNFDLTRRNIMIDENQFSYLIGTYIVIKTSEEGGGPDGGMRGEAYPDGHNVKCVKSDNNKIKISFYQTGCFTAMIKEIEPIGKAKATWDIK